MKKVLLLLFCITSIVYGQKQIPGHDTLSAQLIESQKYAQGQDSLNKMLEQRILEYKMKEDYYSAALGDQATRFSLIVGVIFTLIGAFVVLVFTYENRKLGKRIRLFETEFKELKNEANRLQADISYSEANIYALIARYHSNNSEHILAMDYSIRSAKYWVIVGPTLDLALVDENNSRIIEHLNYASKSLSKLLAIPAYKDSLKDFKEVMYRNLDKVATSDSEKVKTEAAKVRVAIATSLE